MADAGLQTDEHIIADGKIHRCRVNGDRSRDAWYVLHTDNIPAGAFGCWKRNIKSKWCTKRQNELSEDEQRQVKARVRNAVRNGTALKIKRAMAASRRYTAFYRKLSDASADHPYLKCKNVQPHGIKTFLKRCRNGSMQQVLVISVCDINGKIYGVQIIFPDGFKRFAKGTDVASHFLILGDSRDRFDIVEGFATGVTAYEATGISTAVAFNASNLAAVAKVLNKAFTDAPILIAGDNDQWKARNTGLSNAGAAAKACNGRLCLPNFSGLDISNKPTDFNDLAAIAGIDEVARQLKITSEKYGGNSDLPDIDGILAPNAISSHSRDQHGPTPDDTSEEFDVELEGMAQNMAAKSLAKTLIINLLFNNQIGSWMCKKGDIWEEVSAEEAKGEILMALELNGKKRFTYSYFNSITSFLKIHLNTGDWTTSHDYLPLKNGVLNLDTLTLEPYSDKFRFLWQLPYDYNLAVHCPTIKRWLEIVTKGDKEVIKVLLAWMRAVLCGYYEIQKYLELIGPGGTGKSTFIRLVMALIGANNAETTDLKTLETSRFESANLYGKRLAVISDSTRFGGEVSTLKQITGGDPIRNERKHIQNLPNFVFTGMVMIAANEPIQSSDYTSGLARRRISVRFDYRITADDKLRYPDGIEVEMIREIPGLLNLLMSFNRSDVFNTLSNPDASIRRFNLNTALETNPIMAWMHERLVRSEPGAESIIGRNFRKSDDDAKRIYLDQNCLFANYVMWCEDGGRRNIGLDRFSGIVDDLANSYGIKTEKKRYKRGRYMTGLRLREESDADTNELFDFGPVPSGVDPVSSETRVTVGDVENIIKNDGEYF